MDHERAAVVHRWRHELRAQALLPDDFDAAMAPLVDELAVMLREGPDAARVFGERLQGRGAQRFADKARLRDTEREVNLLATAIVATWAAARRVAD